MERNSEIAAAIEQLEEKALGRVQVVEEQLESLATSFGDLQKSVILGGGSAPDAPGSVLTPQKKAKLGNAFRALLKGDTAKANALFAEVSEQKDAFAGSDLQGGVLTVTEFSSEMTRVAAEFSPISRLAREVNLTTSGTFEEAIDREQMSASWVGETESRPDTDTPKLGMLRIEAHELMAQPRVSQMLVDDAAIDIVAWLTQKIGSSFGLAESDAFLFGDGVKRPRGILSYPLSTADDATRPWGTLQVIDSGVDGNFIAPTTSANPADVLVDLTTSLKAQYRANARFVMSRRTAAIVQKMRDADGRYVWSTSLIAGQPSTLLGFAVELDEHMPNPSADSLSILFGDFRAGYTVTRRLGQRFLQDPYTAKPWIKIYSFQRVGGAVSNTEAIKVLRLSGP